MSDESRNFIIEKWEKHTWGEYVGRSIGVVFFAVFLTVLTSLILWSLDFLFGIRGPSLEMPFAPLRAGGV